MHKCLKFMSVEYQAGTSAICYQAGCSQQQQPATDPQGKAQHNPSQMLCVCCIGKASKHNDLCLHGDDVMAVTSYKRAHKPMLAHVMQQLQHQQHRST